MGAGKSIFLMKRPRLTDSHGFLGGSKHENSHLVESLGIVGYASNLVNIVRIGVVN
jgi:hypothetical protein